MYPVYIFIPPWRGYAKLNVKLTTFPRRKWSVWDAFWLSKNVPKQMIRQNAIVWVFSGVSYVDNI